MIIYSQKANPCCYTRMHKPTAGGISGGKEVYMKKLYEVVTTETKGGEWQAEW